MTRGKAHEARVKEAGGEGGGVDGLNQVESAKGPMPNAIVIRRFEVREAEVVSRLIVDNLLQVNVYDYGEATVRQLARFYTPEFVMDYALAGEMVVALEGQMEKAL